MTKPPGLVLYKLVDLSLTALHLGLTFRPALGLQYLGLAFGLASTLQYFLGDLSVESHLTFILN